MTDELRIAVAIATTGRATILTDTLEEIARQTHRPERVAICPARDGDVDHAAVARIDLPITFSGGTPGACAQRNALLRDMPDVDVVLFLDDDFMPSPNYLAELARLFKERPDVVLATGRLIADGAHGAGFDAADARSLIAADRSDGLERLADIFCGYGCNMAVRWSAIARDGIRFDENLPLYSWAEDIEFSRQVARFGRLVRSDRLRGVHLATKQGRTSDLRLGYSQVANQVYLRRKGVIPVWLAIFYTGRNVLANLQGMVWSERHLDRRSRLIGNVYGLLDLLRGRSSPMRILDL